MRWQMAADVREILNRLLDETKKHLIIHEDRAYFSDPVFGIVRNRVNAEICKTLIRMGDLEHVPGLIRYITDHQNPDGSWNEIHINYNQPSALVTSFIGDAILDAYHLYPREDVIYKAKEFVLSKEINPGFFLKSKLITADHLNADASCGAFLAKYGYYFSDDLCFKAAERAAKNICENQLLNGSYPYTIDQGNYPLNYNIPCIHYQGVTLYYLIKINHYLRQDWIHSSIIKGAQWLKNVQREDGRFRWSFSGLNLAFYLTGSYAFAHSVFSYASQYDEKYISNIDGCIKTIDNNLAGLALRWEKSSWDDFLLSFKTAYCSAQIGNYSRKKTLFRFCYNMYREIARRRFSDDVLNDQVFKLIIHLLNLEYTVIEASKNFHDLFITSEIMDCLSYSLIMEVKK